MYFVIYVHIAEPILESVPQAHIMLVFMGQNYRLFFGYGHSIGQTVFFFATFASSVFSASKGIAGFLLHGPCKLVPTDGLFGGMGKLGFILLVLNIATTICGKGAVLGLLYNRPGAVSFTTLVFSEIKSC